MEAEVRALRAQISPHFIYNSLAAIASFVRTDPERARELLLEFADFTRYSFRAHGDFTTLAEELRSIERYLTLERARFGDRLQVTAADRPRGAAGDACPSSCLQPLVENAVRHGLAGKAGGGHMNIIARTRAPRPRSASRTTASAWTPTASAGSWRATDSRRRGAVQRRRPAPAGLRRRLRSGGRDRPGAGTKVTFRVPKYAPGVHASA